MVSWYDNVWAALYHPSVTWGASCLENFKYTVALELKYCNLINNKKNEMLCCFFSWICWAFICLYKTCDGHLNILKCFNAKHLNNKLCNFVSLLKTNNRNVISRSRAKMWKLSLKTQLNNKDRTFLAGVHITHLFLARLLD